MARLRCLPSPWVMIIAITNMGNVFFKITLTIPFIDPAHIKKDLLKPAMTNMLIFSVDNSRVRTPIWQRGVHCEDGSNESGSLTSGNYLWELLISMALFSRYTLLVKFWTPQSRYNVFQYVSYYRSVGRKKTQFYGQMGLLEFLICLLRG